jgi:hypothetical protein
MDRRHTGITGTAKAYSGGPACGYSRGYHARQRAHEALGGQALDASFPASDPVSIVTSHEEEDWGTEPAVPEPPAKPVPPRNP